ncbi:MAG: LysM repeat protein [Candidatus Poriferisodalaceae bacterium]|jgi:LysM repeat protein
MHLPRAVARHIAMLAIASSSFALQACGGGSGDNEVIPTTNPVLTTLRPELTTTTTGVREQRSFYVVQPGDNLGLIAAGFEVTVEALRAENGLDSDIISVGQQLLIPPPQPDTTTTAPG